MGNSNSNQQINHLSNKTKNRIKQQQHPTLNNNKLQNENRKRKSLELPDLDPHDHHHHHINELTHIHQSISNSTQQNNLTSTLQNTLINQFQLRLTPRSRSSSINTSRPTTPNSQNNHIPTPTLDHLSFDHSHHPLSSSPINLLTNPPPNQAHPDLRLNTSNNPINHSPIISSAPLQQPIETVLPPLPPSIPQPFPLPSLEADSAQLPTLPLTSAITDSLKAATALVQASPALDIGAGPAGVPTLITWKEPANEVFVTGTFSKWRQQIKLRKPQHHDQSNQQNAFSALVALPPGPHQLKFIVDRRWKTSKYLPSATDDKGNLINYLQVNPGDQPFRGLGPRGIWSGYTYGIGYSIGSILDETHQNHYVNPEDGNHHNNITNNSDSEEEWTTEIPVGLLAYEEYHDRSDSEEQEQTEQPSSSEPRATTSLPSASSSIDQPNVPVPGQAGFAAEPPKLPAQLREGILNLSSRSPQLASDDNSLLPRPDHSVLNHLAASPIRHGLLSVGVTSRFKRKYLTTVYYKPVDL